jgi:hypothetical protein
MYVYKFKDTVDGNYIFVLAKSEILARERVSTVTSISVQLVEARHIEEVGTIVIYNTVVTF